MIVSYQEMRDKLPMEFKLEIYTDMFFGDYICDTLDDIADLPKNCAMGSCARVINPLSIYCKNSHSEWVLQRAMDASETKEA